MSLTSSLNISTTALMAHQRNMETISKNIANDKTKGYTRQTANYQSLEYGGRGQGVVIDSISRETNSYAFKRMTDSISKNESLKAQSPLKEGLSAMFSGAGSIADVSQKYENTLIEFSATPDDKVSQEKLKSSINSLQQSISDTENYLNSTENGLQKDIQTGSAEFEAQLENFNQVNKIAGNNPDLNNQRDEIIVKLSEYVGVNIQKDASGFMTLTADNGSNLAPGMNFNGTGGKLGGLVQSQTDINNARADLTTFKNQVNANIPNNADIESGNFVPNLENNISKTASDISGKISVGTSAFLDRLSNSEEMVSFEEGAYKDATGVNIDQETVNMLQTQRAYEAAAKTIQVNNEMFRSLISILD